LPFHTLVRTTINIVDNNALSYGVGGDFVLGVSFRRGDFVRGDFVRSPLTEGRRRFTVSQAAANWHDL